MAACMKVRWQCINEKHTTSNISAWGLFEDYIQKQHSTKIKKKRKMKMKILALWHSLREKNSNVS